MPSPFAVKVTWFAEASAARTTIGCDPLTPTGIPTCRLEAKALTLTARVGGAVARQVETAGARKDHDDPSPNPQAT